MGSKNTEALGLEYHLNWDRLLNYYSMCIEHEGAFDNLIQRSASLRQYSFIRQATEDLISGLSSDLAVDENIKNLVRTALNKGEALYYGYPTVLIVDELQGASGKVQKKRKLGSLFLLELALPSLGQPIPTTLPVKSDSPFLHPQVLSRFGFKEEQLIALIDTYPIDPHLGSHEGLRVYLTDLASELGIPIAEKLDPTGLAQIGEGEIEGFGLHNIAIIFRARASRYHQRLLAEIRQLRGRWDEAKFTSAGLLISGGESSINSIPSAIPLCAPLQINESQKRAVADAMNKRLTIVTGPPGTGKSQLVTNIVATAWISRQSVLVASTNNQAVNVVCERAQKIWPGLIIRTGSREYRDSAKELLIKLLGEREVFPDSRALLSTLERNRNRVFELNNRIQERSQIENRLAELFLGREHLAVHLGWQLENLPPSLSDRKLRRFRRRGSRVRNARILKEWRTRRFLRALGFEHPDLLAEIVEFLNLEEEWRNLLKQERQFQAIDLIWSALIEAEAAFRLASEQAVKSVACRSMQTGRDFVLRFTQTQFKWGEENALSNAFIKILPHLSAWATTSLSAGATIPLKGGLFDLVVIDEASQCSIPTTIPLLFRAKRALIIGDPMQLAHISTLSKTEEDARLVKSGLTQQEVEKSRLSFRRHSIYQALEGRAKKIHLLDEHYRSHPQIIELSNRLFYKGQLTILTNPEHFLDFGEHTIAWQDVRGTAKRPESGSALNEEEARCLCVEVKRLLSRKSFLGSIGIVTPFSAQARLIENMLGEIPDKVRMERNISIGTAHRFQGDERDVIIFSPVASDGLSESSLRWLLGTPNLFNVAITRARSYLLVVGNRHFCEQNTGVLGELARYVKEVEIESGVEQAGHEGRLHSEAEVRLYRALLDAGLDVETKVTVRGYEADFLVKGKNMIINIECDGQAHIDQMGRLRNQDRARDQLLATEGRQTVRFPAWRCLLEPAIVAAEIAKVVK
jgi:very-short-patch-repair endonuclease